MSPVRAFIDVDAADVLAAVSDGDLLEECRDRGLRGVGRKLELPVAQEAELLAADLRAAFASRDRAHFEVLLAHLAPAPALPENAFRREAVS